MKNLKPTFEVDKEGLRKLLSRRGKQFAVLELVQNALDEDITKVTVELTPAKKRATWTLTVSDDNPRGFADLTHAYTLFAESAKKDNPEQRGRFNLGEKLVIALCERATIVTTTGAVEFKSDGRRTLRRRTEAGSVFTGTLRMNRREVEATVDAIRSIIVPREITLEVIVRGEQLHLQPHRKLRTFEATLPTERADAEGCVRPTRRKTSVEIYEVREGEVATLYELGIPVVETGDGYHYNVMQKVPLNTDRDNVTPTYLEKVRTFALNAMADELTPEAAAASWVSKALESEEVSAAAMTTVLNHRFGEKRVIADLSDPEGTKLAVARGYTVITGGSFNRRQWDSVRRTGAALPAGQVTPSPKPYSKDGPRLKLIPRANWTDGMTAFARLARRLARELLSVTELEVRIVEQATWPFDATYGRRSAERGELTLNLDRLKHPFFDEPPGEEQLQLLLHELGHHTAADHLSEEFHEALCALGARLAICLQDRRLTDLTKE